jgi:hypothetical protein
MDAFRNSCSRDAAQGARRAATETYPVVDEEASTAQRRDVPEEWIYKGVQHG